MLGQTLAHLDLLLVFPIPLFTLLLIRGFRADIAWRALAGGLVLVLVAQFLLFVELFATMTMFAGIALIVILVAGSRAEKTRAVNLLPTVALSYAIALVAVSPLLCYMIASGYEPGPPHPPLLFSTDLLNLVIPTSTMELGRAAPLRSVTTHFLGLIFEAGGYIGVPVMLVGAAFARRQLERKMGPLGRAAADRRSRSLARAVPGGGRRPIIPFPGLVGRRAATYRQSVAGAPDGVRLPRAGVIIALWLGERGHTGWIRMAGSVCLGRIDAAESVGEFLDVSDRSAALLQRGALYEISLARRNSRGAALRHQRQ